MLYRYIYIDIKNKKRNKLCFVIVPIPLFYYTELTMSHDNSKRAKDKIESK